MKILVTFENKDISIHAVDLIRTLRSLGHQVYHYCIGQRFNQYEYFKSIIANKTILLSKLPDLKIMDVWLYDLTPGIESTSEKTPFLDFMKSFKGKLICINYEDGYGFYLNRTTEYLIDKTDVFINNALYKDLELYESRIRNKLVLSTSYITNSQLFKKRSIYFLNKSNRAFFTGNITGFSASHKEELKCRVLVPMTVLKAAIPCYYRIHHYDPALKRIFDNDVPQEYKKPQLSVKKYVAEFSLSKYILSLRGMGLTVNRFFEGLASNGLVFSTQFNHMVDFIGQGVEGKHYIQIDWSGSDVVEKITYYIEHDREAEQIANNGRALWEENCMLDEKGLLPYKVRKDIVNHIQQVSGIQF